MNDFESEPPFARLPAGGPEQGCQTTAAASTIITVTREAELEHASKPMAPTQAL